TAQIKTRSRMIDAGTGLLSAAILFETQLRISLTNSAALELINIRPSQSLITRAFSALKAFAAIRSLANIWSGRFRVSYCIALTESIVAFGFAFRRSYILRARHGDAASYRFSEGLF